MPAVVSRPSAPAKRSFERPRCQIYIADRYRADCYVARIIERTGFRPSVATLVFPTYRYPHRPSSEGSAVVIYLNRHLENRPVFRGFIQAFGLNYGGADNVVAECVDERARLNDDCCVYGYNAIDEDTGLPKETLTARDIVVDLHKAYKTWQANDNSNVDWIHLDEGAWPAITAGEMPVEGTPHGSAMEQATRLFADTKRLRTYVRRRGGVASRDVLSAFRVGIGPIKSITYATSDTAAIESQPWGYPIASEIVYRRSDLGVIEKVTPLGRRKRIQKAFALTAAWDSTIEQNVMANPQKFTVRATENGQQNPNYNPDAEFVGRRYALPTENVTNPRTGATDTITPRIRAQLFDDDLEESGKKARPVLRIKYASQANEEVATTGFSILEGRWVMFDEAEVRPTIATPGGAVSAEFPNTVHLIAVWESPDRLSVSDVSSGRSPSNSRRRRITEEDFVHDLYESGGYKLASDGTLTAVASDEDDQKDDAELTALATARLTEMQFELIEYRITLPTFPTWFKLGDRLRINGRLVTDAAVTAIEYDFGTWDTILTLSSGGF